jgi:rSAM/selenodomain-associated transferase 2
MRDQTPALRLIIVIPVLNEAAHIVATLEHLAPLRAWGAQVVVADAGSRDATAALAAPLADAVITAPRGRAAQMNAGGAHLPDAQADDLLLFLHADTTLPKAAWNQDFWVNAVKIPMERQFSDNAPGNADGKGILGWGRFDIAFRSALRGMRMVAWFMNHRSRLSGIATGDQALFMTRALFEAVGGFPSQPLMEDVEMSARLKRLVRPLNLRETVTTSARRWETRGLWRTIFLMWGLRLAHFFGTAPGTLARWYR